MDLESDSMPEVPEEIIQLSGPVLLFVPPYLLFKRLSKHCNLNPVASACAAFLRFPALYTTQYICSNAHFTALFARLTVYKNNAEF